MATKLSRSCGAMITYHKQFEEFDQFRKVQLNLEHKLRSRSFESRKARSKPYKIQVVIHCVYRLKREKISEAQISRQIKSLNDDFRGRNPDKSRVPTVWKGMVADSMIEFELATKTPLGAPSNGVTWNKTKKTAFSQYDEDVKQASLGGADPWPTDKYLNIWVCNIAGLLGYAQFPGGTKMTDGVVINYAAFGAGGTAKAPFNLGRTATHEVGHFLNVFHIWGDVLQCGGSDNVDDTPRQEGPNYDVPAYPHVSCGNGPNGDMFMNYMDYVDDKAMVMFTPQQVERMHAALEGPRSQLIK